MFKEELIPNYKYNTELYHHGILGMKWGKRQGPPYPLNPADHSAAEKKAGYQKSIDKGGYNPKKHRDDPNPNYSDSQRASDRSMYGKRSEKRINRHMNNGENIVAARHREIKRRERIKFLKNAGTVVLSAAIIAKRRADVQQVANKMFGMTNNPIQEKVRFGKSIINDLKKTSVNTSKGPLKLADMTIQDLKDLDLY